MGNLTRVGVGLANFLQQGYTIGEVSSDPESPCTEFANLLGNGIVNTNSCEKCQDQILEKLGAKAGLDFQEVCLALPDDGDYSDRGGCPSGDP